MKKQNLNKEKQKSNEVEKAWKKWSKKKKKEDDETQHFARTENIWKEWYTHGFPFFKERTNGIMDSIYMNRSFIMKGPFVVDYYFLKCGPILFYEWYKRMFFEEYFYEWNNILIHDDKKNVLDKIYLRILNLGSEDSSTDKENVNWSKNWYRSFKDWVKFYWKSFNFEELVFYF